MTRHTLRIILAGLLGIAVVLGLESTTAADVLATPALLTANVTFDFIQYLGIDAEQRGVTIVQPFVFAYEVHHRCLGILPASALIIAIAVQPAGVKEKLVGIGISVPLLVMLNIARLTHLFAVGVSQPEYFLFTHQYVWKAAWVIAVTLLFLVWLKWYRRNEESPASMNYKGGRLSKQEKLLNWENA